MKYPNKTFTINCTMNERWIPHFLSMLKYMQQLGSLGASHTVALFADGDGDYRPKFEFDEALFTKVEPKRDNDGDRIYDAG